MIARSHGRVRAVTSPANATTVAPASRTYPNRWFERQTDDGQQEREQRQAAQQG
jgi:hypothetical protein